MSKTIEFVEKEIENIKELLGLDDVLCLSTDEDCKFWYNRLQALEQIKCELEAWEVMKKRLIRKKYGVFHSKDCFVHNYTRIYLKEIKEDENTEEYQKLKKALEVE